MHIFDVLVVGGGPSGATSALLLARAGWSVAIIEKKSFPRSKVCGEYISATSLPLLEKLGLADYYRSHGGPEVQRVGVFAGNKVISSAMPLANHRWGRALSRKHLDTKLLEEAVHAGASLWQPCKINSITRDSKLFSCSIISNNEIQNILARTIIMANGSWEKSLEPTSKHPHSNSDLLAFKAHFKYCNFATDLMSLLAFPGGYGGLAHSSDDRVTLSCCIRRDTLKKIRKLNPGLAAGETLLQYIIEKCAGVRQVLTNAKREGMWLSAGPIRPGIRKRYENGVFFVGNIAGEAHPVVAEGISMAMQSAWLLSQILIERKNEILSGESITKAGLEYSKLWKAHFRKRIRYAAVFAHLAMRPSLVKVILPILEKFPGILTWGAHLSGKSELVVPTIISTKLTSIEMESTN